MILRQGQIAQGKIDTIWVRWVLLLIACGVTIYLLKLPGIEDEE